MPTALFNRINASRVLTTGATTAALAQDPDAAILGPHAIGEDTEVVRSRFAVLVPSRYVQHVLTERYTPRQLWEVVATMILEDDGMAGTCAPFLDWCSITLMRPEGNRGSLYARATAPYKTHQGCRAVA